MNKFMVGLLVVHGALAGAFSPISVYGIFINDYLAKNRPDSDPVVVVLGTADLQPDLRTRRLFVLHRRPGLRAEADDALSAETKSPDSGSPEIQSPGTGNSAVKTDTVRLTRSRVPTLMD